MDSHTVSVITDLLYKHHDLYETPVKDTMWEEIFNTAVNGKGSKAGWKMHSHDSGADVIDVITGIKYQLKSGQVDYKNNTIKWSSHRTTKHETINEKVNFISENHCDKYVFLARNKKDWDNHKKIYNLVICDSSLIDYTKLKWQRETAESGYINWIGKHPDVPYDAMILGSLSDQLWTLSDIDYLGGMTKIHVQIYNDTEFFKY